jgi:hypothetical protein
MFKTRICINNTKLYAMKKRLYLVFGIVLFGTLLLNNGCKKDEDGASITLPPIESFAINMDDFPSGKKVVIDPQSNYNLAAYSLLYWNSVLAVNLGVPVAVYAAALQQEPVQLTENSWKWEFTTNVGEITYTADLRAEVYNDSVSVGMYISEEAGFQNFLWYTGKFDRDRTGGEWTIYMDPVEPTAWLNIEWDINWNLETFDTKYTVILESNDYFGSYIQYGLTDDTDYNAYYNLHDSLEDIYYSINYNTTTTAGKICNLSLGCLYWDASHNNYVPPDK